MVRAHLIISVGSEVLIPVPVKERESVRAKVEAKAGYPSASELEFLEALDRFTVPGLQTTQRKSPFRFDLFRRSFHQSRCGFEYILL